MSTDEPEKPGVNERRRFYRIEYPTVERPRLIVGKETFEVLNVSEGGIHILCDPDETTLAIGNRLRGRIDFLGRDEIEVAGVVCRSAEKSVTIELTERVPLRIIMSEQRYLIGKYDLLR